MSDERSYPLPERSPLLWFAMLAGPVAWSAHLLLAYAFVPIACDTGWTFLLVAVTAIMALVSLAGAIVSRRLPQGDTDPGDADDDRLSNAIERMRFIAYWGFVSGLFFTAVIILEGLPIVFIDPCSWG